MTVPNQLHAASLRFTIKESMDEDAGFAIESGHRSLLAAFDGMGGMGSRRYQSLGNYSSAYLASHYFSSLLEKDFLDGIQTGRFDQNFDYVSHLQQLFWERAREAKASHLDLEPSFITGSLSKSLPSTVCIALVDKSRFSSLFIWAGDSRGYILCGSGLYQLTRDNVRTARDSYDSLYEDAPMNNFLNADRPFVLHSRHILAQEPGVFLVATDGAFACLPTPFHFEYLLLLSLSRSQDMEDWMDCFKAELLQYANDDVTLAVQPVGFGDFNQLKHTLTPRCQQIARKYLEPYQSLGGHDPASGKALWLRYQQEMYDGK